MVSLLKSISFSFYLLNFSVRTELPARTQDPSTRIRFRFSLSWPTVHTYRVRTVTENGSFRKRSPEWRFLKTPGFRLRVDGQKRKFSNAMMSYTIYF